MSTVDHAAEALSDDRPPAGQLDSVEIYANEQARQSEDDVLAGLRSIDRAEGVMWSIYRLNDPDPSRNGFLTKWGTSMIAMENIRDKFGPGTYRVRGHYPNGTFATQRDVPIAGDAPRRLPPENNAVATPDIQTLLVTLDERQARRDAESEARRAADRDFWKNLLAVAVPVALPKLIDLFAPKREGVAEMLAGLKSLRELEGPAERGGGIKSALDIIQSIRELDGGGGSRAGEKGPWDALTELAKSAGPKLGESLQAIGSALASAKSGGAVTSLPMPNGVHAGAPGMSVAPVMGSRFVSTVADVSHPNSFMTSTTPSPVAEQIGSPILNPKSDSGESENDMQVALLALVPMLRSQIDIWVVKAASDSDPELYADLLLDNLPPNVTRDMLRKFLERDDWWSMLQQFDARVAPYIGWFANLRMALLDEDSSDDTKGEKE